MKLIFCDELPSNKVGRYCHYRLKRLALSGWKYYNLKHYVEPYQEEWFEQIGKWHYELSAIFSQTTKWWWLTPHSRIMTFYPPIFYDLFYALAVSKLCESLEENELYLVGFPGKAIEYIRDINNDFIIEVKKTKAIQKPGAVIQGVAIAKRAALFIKKNALLFFIILFNSFKQKPFKKAPVKAIVYSHFLSFENFVKGGDHFFHHLFEEIPGLKKENILWLYLENIDKPNSISPLRKHFYQNNIPFTSVLSLISFFDLFKTFWFSFFIIGKLFLAKKQLPSLFIDKKKYINFSKDYYRLIFKSLPLVEIFIYFAIKRALKITSPRSIIFPYESKGLERAITKARNDAGVDVKCIAYAHSINNPGLLYFRHNHSELIGNLKADIIACTGERMQNWLCDWGREKKEKTVVIGSSRYCETLPPSKPAYLRDQPLHILVICGLSHELNGFADFIEEDPSILKSCLTTLRIYPYSWVQEQNEAVERIKKMGVYVQENNKSLEEQLKDCDVAIISSTSAGIESMLKGRPIIYLDMHGIIKLDPFAHKGDLSAILRCHTAADLKQALNKMRMKSEAEFQSLVCDQRKLALEIFSKPRSDGIAALLTT